MNRVTTIADRLKTYRSENELTLAEMSEKSGVPAQTLNRYELGQRVPKVDTAAEIAAKIGVNPLWLQGYDIGIYSELPDLPSNILPMPKTKSVPRLGTIACGEPILAEENIETYDKVPEWVKCDFTLLCKGDSMINARIFDGDIVCIRKQPEVENGEIAAVQVDDEATLKRFRRYDDHIVLEAENPQVRPLVYWGEEMESVRVLGKATHFISSIK